MTTTASPLSYRDPAGCNYLCLWLTDLSPHPDVTVLHDGHDMRCHSPSSLISILQCDTYTVSESLRVDVCRLIVTFPFSPPSSPLHTAPPLLRSSPLHPPPPFITPSPPLHPSLPPSHTHTHTQAFMHARTHPPTDVRSIHPSCLYYKNNNNNNNKNKQTNKNKQNKTKQNKNEEGK